jgi:hypothetical protein
VGRFRLPQAGLLRVEVERSRDVGHPKRCASLQTYDLATGAALAGTRCDAGPATVIAGSIEPRRARELALLAFVGPQLAWRRPLAHVSLPRELAPPAVWSFRADPSPPLIPVVRDAAAVRIKVTWTEPLGAHAIEVDSFADGRHQDVVVFQLDARVSGLAERIVRGCPSAELPVRAGAAGSLDRALSDARRAACSAPSRRR